MALTSEQLTLARTWIGSKEATEVFEERYSRLGSLDAAIAESMRSQLAAYIFNRDASITVEDISLSSSANIKALQELIEEFEDIGGTDPDDDTPPAKALRTTRLHRPTYR